LENTLSNPQMRLHKIPSLDGVRGLSFVLVFLSHDGFEKVVPGRLGVNIFFLLSGYLITTLMIREREKTGWISLRMFYLRRTLRIFPPMYAILGATLIYLELVHHLKDVTLAGVLSQAFYFQNYYFHDGKGLVKGLGVLWSLAVEEHFYLLFPPLFLLFHNRMKLSYEQITLALLGICGAIFIWRTFVVFHFPNGLEWARDTTDCRADSILYGCALACFERTSAARTMFTRRRLEWLILPLAAVVLLFTFVWRDPVFRETIRYTLQGLALAPILYYVVHLPMSWLGRFLNLRWLGWLGTLSYALYLLHATVLEEIGIIIHSRVITGICGFFVSILLAYLVHILIEKPTDAMRRRYRHTSDAPRRVEKPEHAHPSLLPSPAGE